MHLRLFVSIVSEHRYKIVFGGDIMKDMLFIIHFFSNLVMSHSTLKWATQGVFAA